MKYCVKCGNEIEEGFMFCPECGTKVAVPVNSSNMNVGNDTGNNSVAPYSSATPGVAKSASMSMNDLLTYIRMAANMEKGYFKLSKIRDNIQSNINELDKKANQAKWSQTSQPPQPPVEPIDYSEDEYSIESERGYDTSGNDTAEAIAAMLFPAAWVGWKKWKSHKEEKKAKEKLKSRYENELKQYLIDKEDYPRKLREHEAYIQSKADEERALMCNIQELYKMKADVEGKMNTAMAHIDTFYSADVLYPKYRGLIPVVMFCEYLESGRCENIKECINTYENDVKHHDIVTRLENIADAEYAKQQAICELTSNIRYGMNQMTEALYDINNQINLSNYNLKIQTECQQQMKDDLDAIKWYEDWKYIKSMN